MITITITINDANEKGTTLATCVFADSENKPVVPTSIKWTLVDSFGNVINNREQVVVSVPAATTKIVLSGNDLSVLSNETRAERVCRYVVIEVVYSSTLGTDLQATEQGMFYLKNLHYIT